MARTNIPIDVLPNNGGAITLTGVAADSVNNHELVNDGRTFLVAENEDAATKTVTVDSVADPYGRTGDTAHVVPAAVGGIPGKAVIGPFLPSIWNQGGGSKVNVDVSASTSLRLYAFRFRD